MRRTKARIPAAVAMPANNMLSLSQKRAEPTKTVEVRGRSAVRAIFGGQDVGDFSTDGILAKDNRDLGALFGPGGLRLERKRQGAGHADVKPIGQRGRGAPAVGAATGRSNFHRYAPRPVGACLAAHGCGVLEAFLGVDGDWVMKSEAFEFVSVPFPQVLAGLRKIELLAVNAGAALPSGQVPLPYATLSMIAPELQFET